MPAPVMLALEDASLCHFSLSLSLCSSLSVFSPHCAELRTCASPWLGLRTALTWNAEVDPEMRCTTLAATWPIQTTFMPHPCHGRTVCLGAVVSLLNAVSLDPEPHPRCMILSG